MNEAASSQHDDEAIRRHVEFAGALDDWIERAGVTDPEVIADLAVGFADVIHAAGSAKKELDALLAIDPTTPKEADAALQRLAYLHVLFLDEIKNHIADLEKRWPVLEQRLENISRRTAE